MAKRLLARLRENLPVTLTVAALAAALVAGAAYRAWRLSRPDGAGGAAPAATSEADGAGHAAGSEWLVETLCAGVWSTPDGLDVLTFGAGSFSERRGGAVAETEYRVAATRTATTTSKGGAIRVTTFAVETPSGPAIGTLTQAVVGGEVESARVECGAFSRSGEYVLVSPARAIDVDGPGERWCSSRGTSEAGLVEAVSEWCALNCPTARSATWDRLERVRHEDGSVDVTLTLDNNASTRVTVTVDLETGEVSVRQGGWR